MGVEDAFIWQPLRSGIYSVKSGYHSAMTTGHNINPISAMNWFKDVWSGAFSPKLKVFLWPILQRALPFGENLQRKGYTTNVSSRRCGATESEMHIFFNCNFAQRVWNLLPINNVIHLAAQQTFDSILVTSRKTLCLPRTCIIENILPWVCWQI